jgi:LysM repeat protein
MMALGMVRHTGRLLAPIAIIAVAVGVYLIIHANVATHSATTIHTTLDPVRHSHHRRAGAHPVRPVSYTVRAGDTLSTIASRTRVPLTRIEALNPSLTAPYNLHTGQRLRLRR